MSEPNPSPKPFSPFWLLLLLPVGLLVGKLIGGMPAPAPNPAAQSVSQPAAMNEAGPIAAPVRGASGASSASGEPLAEGAHAVPVEVPDVGTTGDGTMHWLALSDAFAESQRTGKPLLIDFNADWCGPCQRLKQTVFDNPSYAGAIDAAVIPVSIVDRQREDGRNAPETENLQHRFGVRAFPTLVILSPATGKIVRTEGAAEPGAARDWILQGAAAVK